jgi:hypothetical protein
MTTTDGTRFRYLFIQFLFIIPLGMYHSYEFLCKKSCDHQYIKVLCISIKASSILVYTIVK